MWLIYGRTHVNGGPMDLSDGPSVDFNLWKVSYQEKDTEWRTEKTMACYSLLSSAALSHKVEVTEWRAKKHIAYCPPVPFLTSEEDTHLNKKTEWGQRDGCRSVKPLQRYLTRTRSLGGMQRSIGYCPPFPFLTSEEDTRLTKRQSEDRETAGKEFNLCRSVLPGRGH